MMKKTVSAQNVDGTRIEEISNELVEIFLKYADGKSAGLGSEYRADILHLSRSDDIDIFVVRGETRDKMRAQLPKECQPS